MLITLYSIVLTLTIVHLDWLFSNGQVRSQAKEESVFDRDVFLGGSCGQSTWREVVAIPILK